MSTIVSQLLEKDLTEALGLAAMTEEERTAYLDEVGGVVMERALLDFVTLLTEEEQTTFQQFIEQYAEDEQLLDRLTATYPGFIVMLEDSILRFKADAVALTLENDTAK